MNSLLAGFLDGVLAVCWCAGVLAGVLAGVPIVSSLCDLVLWFTLMSPCPKVCWRALRGGGL